MATNKHLRKGSEELARSVEIKRLNEERERELSFLKEKQRNTSIDYLKERRRFQTKT